MSRIDEQHTTPIWCCFLRNRLYHSRRVGRILVVYCWKVQWNAEISALQWITWDFENKWHWLRYQTIGSLLWSIRPYAAWDRGHNDFEWSAYLCLPTVNILLPNNRQQNTGIHDWDIQSEGTLNFLAPIQPGIFQFAHYKWHFEAEEGYTFVTLVTLLSAGMVQKWMQWYT